MNNNGQVHIIAWRDAALFVVLPALFLCFCHIGSHQETLGHEQYNVYCGQCHQAPDPTQLPKDIWSKHVMPEMAKLMQFAAEDQGPIDIFSMEQDLFQRDSMSTTPSIPMDQHTWDAIRGYLEKHAPDHLNLGAERISRNAVLQQFRVQPIRWNPQDLDDVTCIQFDETSHQYIVGDSKGRIHFWPDTTTSTPSLQSAVLNVVHEPESLFVTEVGYLDPSDAARGSVHTWQFGVQKTIIKNLQRPVFTQLDDLNGDGSKEILICEFGNTTGKLSLWSKQEQGYTRTILLEVPGTINLEIEDMDNDGKDDIIVLSSQAQEGINILYQKKNLHFEKTRVINLSPEYGSSWFELIDYNHDDHLDIVLVNGDNADYSITSKPFHGLRLFINDGTNQFKQTWFYPIFGATRVCTHDYDLDGDLDFAVMSFFPDYNLAPDESFVYLENITSVNYEFKSHTFPQSTLGRWLVMDDGDFDEDGDHDILLGSFLLPVPETQDEMMAYWQQEKVQLLLLENMVK